MQLVGFAAEEIKLTGSRWYVDEAKLRGELDGIVGVVNLDCIARGEKLDVLASPDALLGRAVEAARALGLLDRYELETGPATGGVDSHWFADAGVPAVTILHFPYDEYHLPADLPGARRRAADGRRDRAGHRAWSSRSSPARSPGRVVAMVTDGLAELHTHLGGSVASDIMWSLAHEQGIALPTRDYWEFDRMVTVSDPRGVPDLDSLDRIYHLTELIQSSPLAVERSVHAAIGGAYRSQHITTLELRFNPMKRNRGGERDLDHIILAAIRGLDLASLEYPQVRAGLILMMDRTFSADQNMVIVEKAIRYASRGIVGIDIAGPRPGGGRYDYTQIREHVELARDAGLGVTIHVGEEGGAHGVEELGEVVEALRPDRIGHGILAARDPELMASLRAAEITLEICPTSNLLTKALADEDAVREVFRAFVEHGVQFTIATDGPEMMRTHLRDEFELLLRIGALDEEELRRRTSEATRRRSSAATPTRGPNTPFGRYWSAEARPSLGRMQALRDPSGITSRQRQVVELIAQGLSNDEVGLELGISPRTAKAHCDVLRQKLGVPRRRQIPVAFRLLTGEDPLATRLESAKADNGG